MDVFFSIIVTAYNSEKYIIEALKSVESQTYRNFEVLIIEDNSEDNTHNLISDFIRYRSNWKLYSNGQNKGIVYSRNRAFDLAIGKYIAILDGDDVWEKEKLEKQYQILKDDEFGLCYTSYSFINEQSTPVKYVYHTKEIASYKSLLMENYIGCSTAVLKSDIAKGYKMNHNVAHEDYYYWLTLLKNGIKAKGIAEALTKYRIHDKSRSYNKMKSAKDRFVIYQKFEKLGLIKTLWNFFLYSCRSSWKYFKIGTSSGKK